MSELTRLTAGLSTLVGLWVLASAFVLEMSSTYYLNVIVVGAAVVVLAGYSTMRAMEADTTSMWTAALAALLGLWLVASPFVYEASQTVQWSTLISGVVVAALSGYTAYETRRATVAPTAESART